MSEFHVGLITTEPESISLILSFVQEKFSNEQKKMNYIWFIFSMRITSFKN